MLSAFIRFPAGNTPAAAGDIVSAGCFHFTAAFHDKTGPAGNQPFYRSAAGGACFQGPVAHVLEALEPVSAFGALIIIGGHNLSSVFWRTRNLPCIRPGIRYMPPGFFRLSP